MTNVDPDCSLCSGESCRGSGGPLVEIKGQTLRVCDECCKKLREAHDTWTDRVQTLKDIFVTNKDVSSD